MQILARQETKKFKLQNSNNEHVDCHRYREVPTFYISQEEGILPLTHLHLKVFLQQSQAQAQHLPNGLYLYLPKRRKKSLLNWLLNLNKNQFSTTSMKTSWLETNKEDLRKRGS